jgi:peptidoglycan/xylan/chitin deacetylase (PgdA/CDA1 family)
MIGYAWDEIGSRAAGALRLLVGGFVLAVAACEGAPQPGTDAARPAADSYAPPDADAGIPQPPAIAITIDDLPWIGAVRPGQTRAEALGVLIDTLVARNVPAIGFANCERAGPRGSLLRQWVDAGLELGNHSAAHLDLNSAPLERWLDDVRSCHALVAELTGESTIWFRYPFLHQGPDAARQSAALGLLEEMASPVAHVTIDNSDWILAVAYGEAVTAGDEARAAAVAHAFIEHILEATAHYQDVAREKVGRDVPHVLLLHANLMVAENIGALLDRLQAERGFRFVSLAAAQRDPVYTLPDEYTGGDGLSWLYRMAPATPQMKAWDDAEARRLREVWR